MAQLDATSSAAMFLNNQLAKDPEFIQELMETRFVVNNPALDVIVPADDVPTHAGFLGVLNGLMDFIGHARLVMVTDVDEATGSEKILRFEPRKPLLLRTLVVGGIEVEVDASLEDEELERLKASLTSSPTSPRLDIVMVNYLARITKLPEGVDALLVSAPGCPESELQVLQQHFNEAFRDSNYSVIVNYEVILTGRGPGKAPISPTAPSK